MSPRTTGTKIDPLKCGECGGDSFRLVHVGPLDAVRVGGGGHGEVDGHIKVICIKCKDASKIEVRVHVTVDGNLCGGWK